MDSTNARWGRRRAWLNASTISFVVILIFGSLPTTSATFSIARCCTLAVRQDFHKYIDEFYPWQVCNLNTDINYGNNQTFASVMRTMAWAKDYCQGTQWSSLRQWLLPLSTYISPYIGVLMLSPLGDVRHHNYFSTAICLGRGVNAILNILRQPVQEYCSLLGDPVSATFGALHEIWSDARTLKRIDHKSTKISWLEKSALWITALAGDIRFTEETSWNSSLIHGLLAQSNGNRGTSLASPSDMNDKSAPIPHGNEGIRSASATKVSTVQRLLPSDNVTAQYSVERAIEMVIIARKGFVSGILIPIVLLLAVTAATFYDAYSNTGDKDTALDLAYCVWFSWMLVLGVAGNCYASSLKPEVAQRAFHRIVEFGDDPMATPLRHRYANNYLWDKWAERPDNPPTYREAYAAMATNYRFWLRFCIGQLVGFCCISFTSACAIAIAWTTPTVGLGCRSFNFILWVIVSFVTAFTHVLCSWLDAYSKAQPNADGRNVVTNMLKLVRSLYVFLVFGNALVLILGTIFHLVGVFRTCWCERLTWADDTLIELNNKTQLAYDSAHRYWLSTAYVAFGVVWLACLVAIVLRSSIVQEMDGWGSRHPKGAGLDSFWRIHRHRRTIFTGVPNVQETNDDKLSLVQCH